MFKVKPKAKPKLWQVRKQMSRALVWLARKTNPECDYFKSYYLEQLMKANMDAITFGTGAIRVEYVPFNEIPKADE